eukprot:359833-Hanusia_phi.AAC.1
MEMVASVARTSSMAMKGIKKVRRSEGREIKKDYVTQRVPQRRGSMLLDDGEDEQMNDREYRRRSRYRRWNGRSETYTRNSYERHPNRIERQRPNFDNPPPSCTTRPYLDECNRWRKNIEREIADYERNLRGSSDYRYGREARDRRSGVEPNMHNI